MKKLIIVVAIMAALTACHSHKETVCETSETAVETVQANALAICIDSTSTAMEAEIDSPMVVVMQRDSVRIMVTGKRMKLSAQRQNAVTSAAESQSASKTTIETGTKTETKSNSSHRAWSAWLAWALVAILTIKLLSKKLN